MPIIVSEMRIDEVGRARSGKVRRSPLKRLALEYLESHCDEVFGYRDAQMTADLGISSGALGFTLWALAREGAIEKLEVDGKVYFGAHEAIAKLRRKLSGEADPFERAYRNLVKIRERHGNIDVLGLLDQVREGK